MYSIYTYMRLANKNPTLVPCSRNNQKTLPEFFVRGLKKYNAIQYRHTGYDHYLGSLLESDFQL